jgi:hypothetical protein
MRFSNLILFLNFFSLFISHANQNEPFLRKGLYKVIEGNNDSICPQEIKPLYDQGKLVQVSTVFVGECYYWGPFHFPCQGHICEIPGLMSYEIFDEENFKWRNLGYDIWGIFTLSRSK